jgi:DNA replication and repair protein RecF
MNSLYLENITVVNYKNIVNMVYDLDKNINCFVGDNGVGKTNILDSIYHLSAGKSYFNSISSQTIKHDENYMFIEGIFSKNTLKENLICSLKRGKKKTLKRNGKIYKKLSEHVGLIPLVMISPSDRDLIQEGSSLRRKFIDSIISQNNKLYLNHIINYHKVLNQRNALLKYFNRTNSFDKVNISIYNDQLFELSKPIYETRKIFFKNFAPVFFKHYNSISQNKEKINISFQSQLEFESLESLLENSIKKDRILQYTSCGIHKDDLVMKINGHPIKKYGSQGQQKSFLIALKLAQFDYLKSECNSSPILLLDDIFDKLDNGRVKQLIQLVNNNLFGQIFISDTDFERTNKIIQEIDSTFKIFKL